MADNLDVSPGTGATVRADEVGGALYQVIKPAFGIDGVATLVSSTDPLPVTVGNTSLPVTGPLTDTQLRATPLPVTISDATVTVDGAVTVTGSVTISDGSGALTVDGTVVATDGGGSLTVDGTVTASTAIVTLTNVTNTTATSGDNTIIAAPSAGNRIVVHQWKIQLEAATATTVLLKNGSTTYDRLYCAAAGDGAVIVYPTGKEWRLDGATALVFNLSGANAIGYSVRYTTEAV
jgi:hypothetical protein